GHRRSRSPDDELPERHRQRPRDGSAGRGASRSIRARATRRTAPGHDLMALTGLSDDTAAAALSNPQLLRQLQSPVGEFTRPGRAGNSAIVTRFAEVAEVLENDDAFHVGEIYAEAMARTIGVF